VPTPQHVTTRTGDRTRIKCQGCGTSMDVETNGMLGAAMLENWPRIHKCPKPLKETKR
jgi:hypothetical protein